MRGWGRSLRTAASGWYNQKSAEDLALQVIKYQQRDGWSHKDVLRLAHPTPASPAHRAIFRYVQLGAGEMSKLREGKRDKDPVAVDALPAIIGAFEEIHAEGVDKKRAIKLITDHKLPHECVPNELKSDPAVWEAMLPHMGITALIRNLGKLSSLGMTGGLAKTTKLVAARLTDAEILKRGRVHPMTVLYAAKTYAAGRGVKGSLTWTPERIFIDALDEAFYLAFGAVEPTGKATMLALDVSGSMGYQMSGTNVSCREASAAMAMVTARAEKDWMCVGFTSGGRGYGGMHGGDPSGLTKLSVSPRQRLDDIVQAISGLDFGGTDCALPMLYATKHKLDVDVFHVYTDNETWAGSVHPFQALSEYRQKSGRNAKLVVIGMTATEFSIADPTDAGMLDVVGFDAAAPQAIAEFAKE
jgi:60 kDa SS-A/Ro ribonucleoprotein